MKVVLFGAAGTIGRAVQKTLEEKNHEVVGVGRKSGAYQADLRDPASLAAVFKKIGRYDHVACAAGEVAFVPLEQSSDAHWADSFQSKAMGQINLVRAGITAMSDKGSFALVSGILAEEQIASATLASTINATIEGFVRSVAVELPRGIRINCISPTVLTEAVGYHPFFPGFPTVDAAEVGAAYLRAISNPMTGKVLKLHKTQS